jgi:hypothetical protein
MEHTVVVDAHHRSGYRIVDHGEFFGAIRPAERYVAGQSIDRKSSVQASVKEGDTPILPRNYDNRSVTGASDCDTAALPPCSE